MNTSFPMLTEAALCAWVGNATAGDRLAYHRGFLAIDAAPEGMQLTVRQRTELLRVACRARRLAGQGLVHLVQQRLGAADYLYLVVARPRPRVDGDALDQVLGQAGELPDQQRPVQVRRSA